MLEIVSEPDISSPEEAFDYLTYLKLTLQYIGASDCDMEKGLLRCDANISLRKKGAKELGTKVELKNMNSFRGVRDALAFEAKRQERAIKEGEKIIQETRLWDEAKQKTFVMRTKEEAHDYRYFPEPDLLDFTIPSECIKKQEQFVCEAPLDKRARIIKEYNLPEAEVDVIVSDLFLADFFEAAVKEFNQPKKILNWIIGPFIEQRSELNETQKVKITPDNFAKIVKLFCEDKLNNLAAKKVLSACLTTNANVDDIVEKEGLLQVSSTEELSGAVNEAIGENPKAVQEYKNGKQQAIMFLVGQVMRKTKGKANPKVVREIIEKSLQ